MVVMSAIKDEAIVLRRLDYSETSQVLALFTRENGKARVIAKGIKKSTRTRFAPAIDLLERGRVVLSVRHAHQEALAILTEWTQTHAHSGLRSRLDRLYAAQYAAAVTSELTEDWDPHTELFDALADTLAKLPDAANVLAVATEFQQTLLDEIGSAPVLTSCIGCHCPMPSPGDIHFTSFEGGLLCRNCEAARVEKKLVRRETLEHLLCGAPDSPGARSAFELLDYHLTHLMGKPLALTRMLLAAC